MLDSYKAQSTGIGNGSSLSPFVVVGSWPSCCCKIIIYQKMDLKMMCMMMMLMIYGLANKPRSRLICCKFPLKLKGLNM